MTEGQLHTIFTSSVEVLSGTDISELGEDNKFTWHQFHVKGWGAQDFDGHAPVAIHNITGRVVPLTWLLLNSQLTVELINNPKMLLDIRKVRVEDTIRVHCNSGFKIVDRVGDLPGYDTVWYKLTGIANILSMSRATKIFRVVFNSKGRNFFRMFLLDRELRFQLSSNGLYYFDAADRGDRVLVINMVLENQEDFTQKEYKGSRKARQAMHKLGLPSEQEFEKMVS